MNHLKEILLLAGTVEIKVDGIEQSIRIESPEFWEVHIEDKCFICETPDETLDIVANFVEAALQEGALT